MAAKAKTFDCVEMKRRAQEKLLAEYHARREQFASYSEFLAATVKEDPWQRQLWEKTRRSAENPAANTPTSK